MREARDGRRRDILGVPVDAVDMAGACAFAKGAVVAGRGPARILAVNPEKVIALGRDPRLLQFFVETDLLIPDGIGVVWAARWLHGVKIGRVAGADLMLELCSLAAEVGWRVYLLGATPDVNETAARRLKDSFPSLTIAGRSHGYRKDAEWKGVVEEINQCGADLLFIALGSPRQERWIAEYQSALNVKVIQGVGGTFDVIAGQVARAPLAWRRANAEWLYRLLAQPSRIRRHAALPVFAWRVFKAVIRRARRGAPTSA